MAFLPGFTEPTLALLYAPEWTWSGRLEHLAHNVLVSLVTLTTTTLSSSSSTRATLIATSPALPYSCLSLTPCPPAAGGGVLVQGANGLLHVDPLAGRVVACPANGWLARDYPPGRVRPAGLDAPAEGGGAAGGEGGDEDGGKVRERLEGARVVFLDPGADAEDPLLASSSSSSSGAGVNDAEGPAQALVWCPSGAVLALEVRRAGRAVAALTLRRVADAGGLLGSGAGAVVRLGAGGRKGGGKRAGREGRLFVASESACCAVVRWWEGRVEGVEAEIERGGSGAAGDGDGEEEEEGAKARAEVHRQEEHVPAQLLPPRRDNDEVEMDFDEDGARPLPLTPRGAR